MKIKLEHLACSHIYIKDESGNILEAITDTDLVLPEQKSDSNIVKKIKFLRSDSNKTTFAGLKTLIESKEL